MRAFLATVLTINAFIIPYCFIYAAFIGRPIETGLFHIVYLWGTIAPALILLAERLPEHYPGLTDLIRSWRGLPPASVEQLDAQRELLDKEVQLREKELQLANARLALEAGRTKT